MREKKYIFNIFVIFLILHLSIWTLVPSITNINLPLDTIEALAWGSNLDWGFNKHPPLSAFFVEIFYKIFGNQDWAYYLLSQLFVCFAFFILWIFQKEFFKEKIYGFLSILLLEGIFYYNYTTPEFNVYISQLPFWALTVLFCWRGVAKNKYQDWLLFGFFAGLGVLGHYLFLYLLAALSFFLIYLINKKKLNYRCFFSILVFFTVLAPHLFWLIENNFVTLNYAFQRTGFKEINILNHLFFPTLFTGKQIGILIPFFIMCFVLISKFKIKINLNDKKLLFLLSVNLIPLILILLTSFVLGVKIRTMWMTPFYLFLGILFIYFFQKKINVKKIKSFFILFGILFILSPTIYSYVSISQNDKRTDFPGKEISYLVQNKWNKNFNNEIKIVVGDEWYAGNLSYHLNSRPKWFLSLENKASSLKNNEGVVYVGNPQILKDICPGVFGTIKPVGYCMIGQK